MKDIIATMALLCFSAPFIHAEEPAWSEVDNGLRGRLLVLPSLKKDSPFYRIFIELQNTEDVLGQRKIRFDLNKLSLSVTKDGTDIPKITAGSYDGFTPSWEPLLLPFQGTIKFQLSFPGMGYQPKQQQGIIDLGPRNCWTISQNGSVSFLSGTLTIQQDTSEHPLMDWYGTIKFPPVEIPKQK